MSPHTVDLILDHPATLITLLLIRYNMSRIARTGGRAARG